MCTYAAHIIFGTLLAFGFLFTLIAFCTPGWSTISLESNGNSSLVTTGGEESIGLWDGDSPGFVQTTQAFMILALIAELTTAVWSVLAFYWPCCKSCTTWPLPIVTAIAAVCILIAICVFGANMNDFEVGTVLSGAELNVSMGYSLWFAIFALVFMVAAAIAGVVLAKVAKVSPV